MIVTTTFQGNVNTLSGTSTVNNLTVNGTLTGDISGNSGTATQLATARNIGGVSFNGTADIDLPGVNTGGNQNTSGTAQNADNINIDESNTNGSFQVTFSATTMQDIADSILMLIMVISYTILLHGHYLD